MNTRQIATVSAVGVAMVGIIGAGVAVFMSRRAKSVVAEMEVTEETEAAPSVADAAEAFLAEEAAVTSA